MTAQSTIGAQRDRDWFASLPPHLQHLVCLGMWRAKNASLPWRRGGEMVSFWEAVVDRLTPDITGDESEDTLLEMRRSCDALGRVVWELGNDREHPLARAVVERAGVDCGRYVNIPHALLSRADGWLADRSQEIRVAAREVREEAAVAWRTEAVRRVVRRRRRGEHVTYGEVADEMNEHPGRGRRPLLSSAAVRRAYNRYASEVLDESEFDSSSDLDPYFF